MLFVVVNLGIRELFRLNQIFQIRVYFRVFVPLELAEIHIDLERRSNKIRNQEVN